VIDNSPFVDLGRSTNVLELYDATTAIG
jgi:hypothetical protein